jgi:hypothetical protein
MTASLVSRDNWADLIPPDDLPERDVYADLGDGAPDAVFFKCRFETNL